MTPAATTGSTHPSRDGVHVRLERLSKRLGGVTVVDSISLDVPEGSFTTLLGPSGCGKTTTLRMIAGFVRPDAGEIYVGGRPITGVAPHRRNSAMVFQEYALFPHLSVAENVGYGLRIRRVRPPEVRRRISEVLALVGLAGRERAYPHQLSGGQQQRVALARALIVGPEVLLLDEPLSNLDAKLRVHVRTEIRALQQELGKTTIYVTHDQEEALSISDQIAVMSVGRIVQVGSPREIYYRPASRFVADFVGLANFVPARPAGADRVRLGDAELDLAGVRVTGPCTVVVRPETIGISTSPPGGRRPALRGVIRRSAFLGSLCRYWIEAAGHEWLVDQHAPGERVHEGEVWLEFSPDRIHLLAAADSAGADSRQG
jgi:ABC-type Fe3+/spermidine/putrescine transport system ATPase subunit